jgi:hypothetical protein
MNNRPLKYIKHALLIIVTFYNLYTNCEKEQNAWRKWVKRHGRLTEVKIQEAPQCYAKRKFPMRTPLNFGTALLRRCVTSVDKVPAQPAPQDGRHTN